ncbi:hypothetical protein EAI_15402, partial [Harpegnathos saltator]
HKVGRIQKLGKCRKTALSAFHRSPDGAKKIFLPKIVTGDDKWITTYDNPKRKHS